MWSMAYRRCIGKIIEKEEQGSCTCGSSVLKRMNSLVMLFDATKGDFVKEVLYTLSPKKALITAVMQYKGNMNSEKYPKDLDGIYKSKAVKGRLLYDLTDNLTMYSQKA